jgi:predicted anti-sigma-YlaC factor YlaD
MKKHNVECKDVMEHICENLGEDLNSKKCADIKAHLQDCENCTQYFKNVEDTIAFYKKYNADLPEGAHERLMNKLGLGDC